MGLLFINVMIVAGKLAIVTFSKGLTGKIK